MMADHHSRLPEEICMKILERLPVNPTISGKPKFRDLYLTECEQAMPLGWCRGLLLLGVDCSHYKLLLWNPLTYEKKEIPDPPYQLEYDYISASALGYDFNIRSHKIVLINESIEFECRISVYTLKTNSWTSVELDTDHKIADYDIFPITLANGAPHWVINHRGVSHHAIEYFDFGTNNFEVVPQPGDYDNRYFRITPQLYDTEGSLCIAYGYRTYVDDFKLEIWVMRRYGVKDSWSKWMSFVEDDYIPFPICFAKNNINVSFVAGRGEQCCAIYNGKEKGIELKSLRFLVREGSRGSLEFDECLKKSAFACDESLICFEDEEVGERS
ncbi:hypothetical protein COLO4_29070 [Corchorus olitorius]|uniref:F-box associated beta-propeller type 1 domain-containing protein n=1 Tax=Corchorus olitorius TaxID=93759 RepID=A0A1R3HGK5_9ROSI|nr:hypothetical protein COLO4_29070 [Corchorus olitorius]